MNSSSKVKVVPAVFIFGGWKGTLTVSGDTAAIQSDDGQKQEIIDFSQVKSASFNSNNGLWAIKRNDGTRVRFQSAGLIFSADRTETGAANNDRLGALIEKYKIKFVGV